MVSTIAGQSAPAGGEIGVSSLAGTAAGAGPPAVGASEALDPHPATAARITAMATSVIAVRALATTSKTVAPH